MLIHSAIPKKSKAGIAGARRRVGLLILMAFVTVAALGAEDLKKTKFQLGPWENDIGYCQAVKVGDTVYISGSVKNDPKDMADALRGAYQVIEQSLKAYKLTFKNVVKENVYTRNIDELIKAQPVRLEFYKDKDFPAATWVQVQRLYSPGDLVEVEVIAVVK